MKMKQTCILVLGMHRSGTSALTGTLNLLDVYLGRLVIEGDKSNQKGYFEHQSLNVLNDEFLSSINSSWDDTFYDEEKLDNIQNLEKLKKIIREEFKYSDTFAIKDPRLAFLFPVYKKALQELNIDIKVILPYRNPIEVASSLNTRNDMSMEKGMLLWAYHFLLAEKFSRGYESVFVGFDELMSEPEKTINTISSKLDLDLDTKYLKQKKEIDAFLEPDLKHHNISMDNLSENTPNIVKSILELKDRFNDSETAAEFDTLRDELFSYQKLFYNPEIINTLKELDQTKETVNQTRQTLSQKEKELDQTKETVNRTLQTLSQKEKELDQTKETVNRTLQTLKVKSEELNQTRENLIQKNKEIENLRLELTSIYTGRSWKITRPLRKFKKMIGK